MICEIKKCDQHAQHVTDHVPPDQVNTCRCPSPGDTTAVYCEYYKKRYGADMPRTYDDTFKIIMERINNG